MQRIMVKSVVTKPTKKEGTNITTIEDEKGAKMSAFNDTALAQLHAGDVLDVEVVIESKYANITGWKLIESKPQPVLQPALGKEPLSREASIEAQTAAKIGGELLAAKIIEQTHPLGLLTIYWCLSKLSGKPQAPPSAPELGRQPSKPESEPLAPEGDKQAVREGGFIPFDWLTEKLEILRGKDPKVWSDANLLSYMKKLYKKEGTDIFEVAAQLTEPQAKHFTKHIEEAMVEKAGK